MSGQKSFEDAVAEAAQRAIEEILNSDVYKQRQAQYEIDLENLVSEGWDREVASKHLRDEMNANPVMIEPTFTTPATPIFDSVIVERVTEATNAANQDDAGSLFAQYHLYIVLALILIAILVAGYFAYKRTLVKRMKARQALSKGKSDLKLTKKSALNKSKKKI